MRWKIRQGRSRQQNWRLWRMRRMVGICRWTSERMAAGKKGTNLKKSGRSTDQRRIRIAKWLRIINPPRWKSTLKFWLRKMSLTGHRHMLLPFWTRNCSSCLQMSAIRWTRPRPASDDKTGKVPSSPTKTRPSSSLTRPPTVKFATRPNNRTSLHYSQHWLQY